MLRPVRIRHYLAETRERGIADIEVLRGSGIDAERLQDSSYVIDAAQCRRVIANMIRLSGDAGIGIAAGERVEPTDFGMFGYALMSCRTMRHTFNLWCNYSASLVGMMSRLEWREVESGFSVRVIEPVAGDPLQMFCTEEILVMMHTVGGALAGTRPIVRRAEFAYPAPPHRARYDQWFDCPVIFDAPATVATVDHAWLERPLRGNDDEFNRLCLQQCSELLAQIQNAGPLALRLRAIFVKNPRGLPRLDEAAALLGSSARSLRRHLHDEGTSYQKLVDEFRTELACEYLRSGRIMPKEIAYLLGFVDQSAFRRAFKQWTGQTPGQWRAANRASKS